MGIYKLKRPMTLKELILALEHPPSEHCVVLRQRDSTGFITYQYIWSSKPNPRQRLLDALKDGAVVLGLFMPDPELHELHLTIFPGHEEELKKVAASFLDAINNGKVIHLDAN